MSYLPVRCFTCGKVLGHLQIPYEELHAEYKRKLTDEKINTDSVAYQDTTEFKRKIVDFMNSHRITRYCCASVILGHPLIVDPDYSHMIKDTTDKVRDLTI